MNEVKGVRGTPVIVTATKEFTFDCAHMLEGHEGLCKNLHGHTYKVHVEVARDQGIESEGPAKGMVIDFKMLKTIVQQHIIEPLDHSFVYQNEGGQVETAIAELLDKAGLKVASVQFRPTAENMAIAFFEVLASRIPEICPSTYVKSVTVWETPTSFAKITA